MRNAIPPRTSFSPRMANSVSARIAVDHEKIAEFCRRWKVTEFSLFGSVLREDFRPDSDVDVLVVFSPDARRSIEDFEEMEGELETLFGRKVDIVQKNLVRNPFRRHHILTNRQILYAA
jgi:predicted nucleotidyltransferase